MTIFNIFEGKNTNARKTSQSMLTPATISDRGLNRSGSRTRIQKGSIYVAHTSARLEKPVSRVHSRDITHYCIVTFCAFTCKCSREYMLHMKTHFVAPPYVCCTCPFFCDKIQSYLTHLMKHTRQRPFVCDDCYHRFTTKGNLVAHMRRKNHGNIPNAAP